VPRRRDECLQVPQFDVVGCHFSVSPCRSTTDEVITHSGHADNSLRKCDRACEDLQSSVLVRASTVFRRSCEPCAVRNSRPFHSLGGPDLVWSRPSICAPCKGPRWVVNLRLRRILPSRWPGFLSRS